MPLYWIALSSITYANKARSYLARRGITVKVVKTPKDLQSIGGCGYSMLTEHDPNTLVPLLEQAGIKPIRIYQKP